MILILVSSVCFGILPWWMALLLFMLYCGVRERAYELARRKGPTKG